MHADFLWKKTLAPEIIPKALAIVLNFQPAF